MVNYKNVVTYTMLTGGIATGMFGCQEKKDTCDNAQLFEKCRSDVKFSLAFVENYYDHVYWCGEAWTTGHGLTILYNADGTYTLVTKDTKIPTVAESDVYEGRYLTYEILPDIKECITVPMDENTMIAACVLRYCIGHKNFKNSSFVKQLNNGVTGEELAKTLTGWRKQEGVPNRCYFFAALMAGKIQYVDWLQLRAEGCYNLSWRDIFVYVDGEPKVDENGFYEWDFSKIAENLKKAQNPRFVRLNLGDGKHACVRCKLVKEIVPDYVLQDVARHQNEKTINFEDVSADMLNDSSRVAYLKEDYKIALKSGKSALKYALTNKQKGAACYNIGVAYLARGKYNKAVKYLEQSLAHNKTKVAKEDLETARQKRGENRKKTAVGFAVGTGIAVGVALGRRRYIMRRNRQYQKQ